MIIHANTRIGHILQQHPGALEAIVGIHPKLEKLRNPILRKLMAGRTSISMASKMAGCTVNDFYKKLLPLGFTIDEGIQIQETKKQMPSFLASISKGKLTDLDVRPIIESGGDPLSLIIEKTRLLESGNILKIINSFEPTPLIILLEKQGFDTYADIISDDLVETYFFKKQPDSVPNESAVDVSDNWEFVLDKFAGQLQTIDVRHLKMPQPMMMILEALDTLPAETALFVYHKRVPVFLLPELATRQFSYRIKEISDGEVNLLIFKE